MAILEMGEEPTERKCLNGFLSDYLNYTQFQESPEDFHVWTILTIIGMILGRSVWINRGFFKIYPNLYVTLVSESGTLHKSTAVNMGLDILKDANIGKEPFSEKITAQALMKSMAETYKKYNETVGLIVASEFAVFFGESKKDQQILELVTDWYECPSHRAYETVARGKQEFSNIAISILSASTPEWLQKSLPESSIGGGFTSRVIFVNRFESGKMRIARPERYLTDEVLQAKANCTNDLRVISNLRGEFSWEPEAEDWFDNWYSQQRIDSVHPKLRGYFSRKGDMILKLAAILQVTQSDDLLLTVKNLESARILLIDNEKFLSVMLDMISDSEMGQKNSTVEDIIRKEGLITFAKLIRLVRRSMSSQELKICLQTLEDSKIIKRHNTNDARGILYEYIRDPTKMGSSSGKSLK